jgi:Uncharacterized protein conserved in bacteria (DUF2252)
MPRSAPARRSAGCSGSGPAHRPLMGGNANWRTTPSAAAPTPDLYIETNGTPGWSRSDTGGCWCRRSRTTGVLRCRWRPTWSARSPPGCGRSCAVMLTCRASGAFASPERRLAFDLNDFDETLPGPFEWDVISTSWVMSPAEHRSRCPALPPSASTARSSNRLHFPSRKMPVRGRPVGTGTARSWPLPPTFCPTNDQGPDRRPGDQALRLLLPS